MKDSWMLVEVVVALALITLLSNLVMVNVSNSQRLNKIMQESDKVLVKAPLKEQREDVFSKYDFLFMGMTNSITKDRTILLKSDYDTKYEIKEYGTDPVNVYLDLVNNPAVQHYLEIPGLDTTEGLLLEQVQLIDDSGNIISKEAINLK